jgi:hypothetical protein
MVTAMKEEIINNGKQIGLPGINSKTLAYQGLLNNNPTPDTVADAEKFFRTHTETLIRLREDHDFLRVVLKETGVEEEKEKHEYTTELSISNLVERNAKYLSLAQKVHALWLELEEPKYQTTE